MKTNNILVFPCGSEVALEIYRSLRYSRHFQLIGANSIDDHGKFIFQNYIGGVPFYNSPDFKTSIREIISRHSIDLVYPAMDSVITTFASIESELLCKVVTSPLMTAQICLSKTKTYQRLAGIVNVPKCFAGPDDISKYPVFAKPDTGYGSRGAKKINSRDELLMHQELFKDCIILEYLPGKEYTVDCFTDRKGRMLFAGSRERRRILNGISVNTITGSAREDELRSIAGKINQSLAFRGAWFFQMKEDVSGNLCLLEIASRLGGSSSAYRCKGVNFALMSAFDRLDIDVEATINNFDVELDRSFSNKYRLNINYKTVYIDLDDTIILNGEVNAESIRFIYECINRQIKVVLLTKHELDLELTLQRFRISNLFDQIIHISKTDEKSGFISDKNAIFIDDSFEERKKVFTRTGVPVFAPDAIESLLI